LCQTSYCAAITYDDFVELFVAPDVERLQLSEIASGRWSQSAVTRHNRYRVAKATPFAAFAMRSATAFGWDTETA
jgi:hypothetical protein